MHLPRKRGEVSTFLKALDDKLKSIGRGVRRKNAWTKSHPISSRLVDQAIKEKSRVEKGNGLSSGSLKGKELMGLMKEIA